MSGICYIFGGFPCNSEFYHAVNNDDIVISADGGYKLACSLGVKSNIVLGDFDTLNEEITAPDVRKYPPEKDDTDLMIAIKTGISIGYHSFVIYGSLGGRIDHTVAAIQSLEYLSERGINGELISDNETINIQMPGQREYKRENFKYISVFSLAEASVVSYEDLKYPLDNYTITQSFPIGVSNEFISEICRIDLKSGKLLVIRTKSDK